MVLLSIFATVALLLAAVGIYGVMSYSVSRRTNEMGVRIALGAQATDVMMLILKQGLRIAALGMAVGIAAALVLTRLMSTLLFGVSTTGSICVRRRNNCHLTIVSGRRQLSPARRATRVDPMTALRNE